MFAKLFRIDANTAFRPSIRDVCDSAFPSHQHRQGRNLILGDVGVVSDAAFEGSPNIPMLNPHAIENTYGAIVESNVDAYGYAAFRLTKHLVYSAVQFEFLGCQLKLRQRNTQSRMFFRQK